jgi:hypothetical protein
VLILSGDGVLGAVSQLACAAHTASVACVTHVRHVMEAVLFLLLVFAVFVDPDAHAIGDQGHEISQSA